MENKKDLSESPKDSKDNQDFREKVLSVIRKLEQTGYLKSIGLDVDELLKSYGLYNEENKKEDN